jgi:hypothetical protein
MRFCWYILLTLVPVTPAMAYKTERVCTKTEATSREPAKKSCKRVLVTNDAQKALAEKEKAKKEKKP